MKSWTCSVTLIALFCGAVQADPADLFPAETLAYVALDPATLRTDAAELDFAKLLSDPELAAFFDPMFETLDLRGDDVVASLFEKMSLPGLWQGPAAVGVRGYEVRIVQNDGKVRRLRFGGKQVGSKQIRQIVGAMLAVPFGKKPRFELTLDFLAVLEPGPRLEELVNEVLSWAVETEEVKVGERKLTRYRFGSYHIYGVVDYQQTVYVQRDGKRWIVASDPELMTLEPRLPLSATKRYREARSRILVEHEPLFFGFLDVHQTWRMFRDLWPLALVEVAEDAGMADWRSIGFGIEMHKGGLRESIAVMIDPESVGFWTLLEAMPAGMKSPKFTPPGALAFLGSKHEIRIFRNRMQAVMEKVAPGSFDAMEEAMAAYVAQGGYHWQDDMLRAPGDELALMLMPPKERGGLPRVVLGADFQNEEAMQSVVVKFRRQLERWASYDSQDVNLPNGLRAIQLLAPIPMHLTFALARGHVFASSDPRTLVEVIEKWGKPGSKSLDKDDPIFRKSIRGLCGGQPTEFMALAYVNMRDLVALLHGWNTALWPKQWFARKKLRDIRHVTRHLGGASMGLRRHVDGVTLDAHSPFGVLLPTASWWVHDRIEQFQRRRADEARRAEREALRSRSLAPDAAYLGATLQRQPVVVLSTAEEAPARESGLEKGDVIVKIAGKDIEHLDDLRRVLLEHKPRQEVEFVVRRGAEVLSVPVKLGRRGDYR